MLPRSSSLDPIFSATVSGVNRISPSPSPTLSAPFSSGVRCRLPLSVVPRQLSSRVPLPLPAMLRFQVQKPFVWFRAKTDRGIVCLAGHLYSVTRAGYSHMTIIADWGRTGRGIGTFNAPVLTTAFDSGKISWLVFLYRDFREQIEDPRMFDVTSETVVKHVIVHLLLF